MQTLSASDLRVNSWLGNGCPGVLMGVSVGRKYHSVGKAPSVTGVTEACVNSCPKAKSRDAGRAASHRGHSELAILAPAWPLLDSIAMATSYDRIAGQSVERLAALSDGIFAVAMTIMVLDLRLPVRESVQSEHDLWRALLALSPRLIMYMMSFLTLGIFWIGQQTQLNHLTRSSRSLSWIHIAFLFAVTLTPFSTMLLAEFPAYRMALVAYWINILLLGAALYFSWVCAMGEGLVKHDIPAEVRVAIRRRIVIAQALYAFGMLLCVFGTYWSIAFIVLVQLNYAIAPKIPGRRSN